MLGGGLSILLLVYLSSLKARIRGGYEEMVYLNTALNSLNILKNKLQNLVAPKDKTNSKQIDSNEDLGAVAESKKLVESKLFFQNTEGPTREMESEHVQHKIESGDSRPADLPPRIGRDLVRVLAGG